MAKVPHKHAKLIKAWADGAEIELLHGGVWVRLDHPLWNENAQYRRKPESVVQRWLFTEHSMCRNPEVNPANLQLTFEDGKLIAAEVLK